MRLTVCLVEPLPPAVWTAALPGAPRRTIRMLADISIRQLQARPDPGKEFGVDVTCQPDRRRVAQRELVPAPPRSRDGILRLLALGCEHGGAIPASPASVRRHLALDVGHVIVMAARALGERLPSRVTDGLWQWTRHRTETG